MIDLFLLNIFLAIGFSAVLGRFTLSGFLVGFLVGFGALWLTKPLYRDARFSALAEGAPAHGLFHQGAFRFEFPGHVGCHHAPAH
jgi:hypothetical protein